MPHYPNQPLPSLPLLVAQRAAQIAQHYQMMRQARLPKQSAPHSPAPGAARKRKLHRAYGITFQRSTQAKFGGGKSQQALYGARQQALPGAIHEAKFVFIVE